jgi:enamine deaminase RidA (YjgF/YER057c/UK114 family)
MALRTKVGLSKPKVKSRLCLLNDLLDGNHIHLRKKPMATITRIEPGARMSDAVIHGDTIYLAGQVAGEAKGKSTREQTIDVLAQIDALLAKCGSSKSKILMTTIYLANISDFAEMNAVWDQWVDKANPTARATIEARLAAPAYSIEIVCIAAR